MNLLADCLDSLILALRLIAQSIAFLFGAHFFLLLHLVHFLATDPVAALQRRSSSSTSASSASRDCRQSNRGRARREDTRSRRRIVVASTRYRPPRKFLHLPSLEPRPHDTTQYYVAKSAIDYASSFFDIVRNKISDELQELGHHLESRGGKTGKVMQYMRNGDEEQLNSSMLHKLPLEIINHILLAAAEEEPAKICLLSKMHHRLVTPRLYSRVDLCDPKVFRHFRITLAVHNPSLGSFVHALSVASNSFDDQGYLPEGIAEPAALGVGIEQILLATPNLKELYLDLFALAALHDGTASRLQRGALPISLVTEYAAPQYLSLPIFDDLRHVELSVFGLDKTAAEHLRKALPRVKSLTLRWVTRESQDVKEGEIESLGVANMGGDDEHDDLGISFDNPWKVGGYMRNDFDSFVDAINLLRGDLEQDHSILEPLSAITVLAWPRATLELSRSYQFDSTVTLLSVDEYQQQCNEPTWNKSFDKTLCKPAFDRPARRVVRLANTIILRRSTTERRVTSSPLTPLRLCVDDTHLSGPRRGPLESWCNQR